MFKLTDLKNQHTPVLPNTPNFHWDEYLQNNLQPTGYGERDFNQVDNVMVMYYICVHASLMQKYREWYGKSINGASGHRPEVYNDVVMVAHGYDAAKNSDHKFKDAGAFDSNVPATERNINKWKELCLEAGLNWSIGIYNWGLHLGFRVNQKNRSWDNR